MGPVTEGPQYRGPQGREPYMISPSLGGISTMRLSAPTISMPRHITHITSRRAPVGLQLARVILGPCGTSGVVAGANDSRSCMTRSLAPSIKCPEYPEAMTWPRASALPPDPHFCFFGAIIEADPKNRYTVATSRELYACPHSYTAP